MSDITHFDYAVQRIASFLPSPTLRVLHGFVALRRGHTCPRIVDVCIFLNLSEQTVRRHSIELQRLGIISNGRFARTSEWAWLIRTNQSNQEVIQ